MRERAAVAFALLLAALGRAQAESAPAALAPARAAELVHLLRHDCGSCHGLFLKGGLGPPLSPSALAGKDPQALVLTVLEGRAGTPMPPWKGLLDEAEARFLVDLLLAGRVP